MEKINVAELLKDCPSGMELDCAMYDNLYLDSLNADYYGTINCYTLIDGIKTSINFTKYGTFNNHIGAKCVIFPKGKTTWEGFQRPFKDGDVVCYLDSIAIFKEWGDATLFRTYVTAYSHGDSTIDIAIPLFGKSIRRETRLATEEEKKKLFRAIKDNGYKWNAETKTLEKLVKLKFKIGDRIKYKRGEFRNKRTITSYDESGYWTSINDRIDIAHQDDWELVPNKFNITTLKPFESRVLFRDNVKEKWQPGIWGFYDSDRQDYPYKLIGNIARYCIPYKGNEHLLGKTDDCDEFYRTWE